MIRRFWADNSGGIAVMAAFAMSGVLSCAALAVDMGSVYLETRKLQGATDLAAMAAAHDLDHAQAASLSTLQANGLSGSVSADVTIGSYSNDPALAPEARFQPGGAPSNAVRVVAHSTARLYFASAILGRSSLDIQRTATAARSQLGAFSIGTRLASLDGGVANALLGGLTGSKVQLSVMDYQALASADVDLLTYARALSTRMNLQGSSFDHVLSSQVTTPTALNALADTLDAAGHLSEGAKVRVIAGGATSLPAPDLEALLDMGPYGDQDHAGEGSGARVEIGALDMATAILTSAQAGRQVALDLGAGLPGLAGAKVWLAIGQRPVGSPWLAVAKDGSTVLTTAQMRLYLEIQAAPGALSALGVTVLKVPVMAQLAQAKARISSLDCSNDRMIIEASPGVGRLVIGDIDKARLNDFSSDLAVSSASLVQLPLISVQAKGQVDIGGAQWQAASFSRPDITAGTVKTLATNDIAHATLSSLVSNTNITVKLAGLGLGLGNSASAVAGSLLQAAPAVDNLLNTVTGVLGVGLGEVDIRAAGLRCHDSALVG